MNAPSESVDVLALVKAGRCANGSERGGGRVAHAVQRGSWLALCGTRPGKWSAGWRETPAPNVTCSRCIAALARVGGAK